MLKKFNFSTFITENDQNNCIELVNNLFSTENWCEAVPKYQTWANLFSYNELNSFKMSFIVSCFLYLNKEIKNYEYNCWCYMSFDNIKKSQNNEELWHSHERDGHQLTGVYYLQNPKNVPNYHLTGTEFLNENISNIIPEDFCWFIFPSHLIHRPGIIQSNQKRYVLSANFKYFN